MKTTVGPLPPVVYWRRRAVVLGAILVVLVLFWTSCSGSDPKRSNANRTALAGSARPTTTGLLTPGFGAPPSDTAPPSGTPSADPQLVVPTTAAAPTSTATPACADTDLSIIAAADRPDAPNGAYIKFSIKIKNTTTTPCDRDLGPDHQELYLLSGTTKVWSSDACDAAHGSNIVLMQPNIEHAYSDNWTGLSSNNGCDAASRKPPGVGKYQLVARLDTRTSAPLAVELS